MCGHFARMGQERRMAACSSRWNRATGAFAAACASRGVHQAVAASASHRLAPAATAAATQVGVSSSARPSASARGWARRARTVAAAARAARPSRGPTERFERDESLQRAAVIARATPREVVEDLRRHAVLPGTIDGRRARNAAGADHRQRGTRRRLRGRGMQREQPAERPAAPWRRRHLREIAVDAGSSASGTALPRLLPCPGRSTRCSV